MGILYDYVIDVVRAGVAQLIVVQRVFHTCAATFICVELSRKAGLVLSEIDGIFRFKFESVIYSNKSFER